MTTISIDTSVARKYATSLLPRIWPGMLLLLPAFISPPSYSSVFFLSLMSVAWIYWVYCVYKINRAIKTVDGDFPVNDKQTALVSLFIGTHPMNFEMLFAAVLLSYLGRNAMGLVLVSFLFPFAMMVLAILWYTKMTSQVADWVKVQAAHMRFQSTWYGVSIGLLLTLPGILMFLSNLTHQSTLVRAFAEATTPVCQLLAFVVLWKLRNLLVPVLSQKHSRSTMPSEMVRPREESTDSSSFSTRIESDDPKRVDIPNVDNLSECSVIKLAADEKETIG